MRHLNDLKQNTSTSFSSSKIQLPWHRLHIDVPLLLLLIILSACGLLILYSASNQNINIVNNQIGRLAIGFVILLIFAHIQPKRYQQWAPWAFIIGTALLVLVDLIGKTSHGGQRWLDIGFIHIQPSEIMKLATPVMIASYLNNKPLPPKIIPILISTFLLAIPVFLTAKQPDLGTAILIAASGFFVLLLAGLNWGLIIGVCLLGILSMPLLWQHMHTYQRLRVLTFLNPERDPLGTGYHIIQSKIALGSGGLLGKGWLQGTQSHLQFLPAHATDFIFAVSGEEFGFIGCLFVLLLYLIIFGRCLYISNQAQDTFTRLLAGSLGLIFIISAFINIGMVTGVMPVVGIPLPLISYGGSSVVTIMAGFGIIMSIHTNKKLWAS